MLNISGINNGVVLDHIQAGKSMDIYHYLNLQQVDLRYFLILRYIHVDLLNFLNPQLIILLYKYFFLIKYNYNHLLDLKTFQYFLILDSL